MSENLETIGEKIIKFNVTEAAIAELKIYMNIAVRDHEDKENAKRAHEARMIVNHTKVDLDKERKILKEDALRWGQAVDREARAITGELEKIESYLKGQEEIVIKYQERLEADRKQKEEEERIEKEKAMEDERIALELEKQAIEKAKQLIEDEKRKIEAEKQRQIDLEETREKARKDAIEEMKIKEQQAEIKRKKDEERIKEKIQKEQEEQIRKAEASPDKEKLLQLIKDLEIVSKNIPRVQTQEALKIIDFIVTELLGLCQFMANKIEEL
jgi:hypothetical protein